MNTILPDLTFEEALEITKIHSVYGEVNIDRGLITTRPFRRPHHTSSPISIIGGGKIPKPGEISLAHFGVLFLDELPEFKKSTLEVLRGPLEDRIVTISRVNSCLTFPCNFMLVASMNPCPCGYKLKEILKCILFCVISIHAHVGIMEQMIINVIVQNMQFHIIWVK